MSYSFSIAADSKSGASQKVAEALDQVVAAQPSHAADQKAAQDAADALIGALQDPHEGEHITVSVSGSLTWRQPDAFLSASVSVNAYVTAKP